MRGGGIGVIASRRPAAKIVAKEELAREQNACERGDDCFDEGAYRLVIAHHRQSVAKRKLVALAAARGTGVVIRVADGCYRRGLASVVERGRADSRFWDQAKWSDAAGSYCFVSF